MDSGWGRGKVWKIILKCIQESWVVRSTVDKVNLKQRPRSLVDALLRRNTCKHIHLAKARHRSGLS